MLSYFTLVVALVCGAIAQISDISTTTVSSSDSSSLLTDSSSSLTATTTSTALGSTLAATGSAQITITGWLGVPTGIVGSIVEANPCETTVVLTCTDATYCLMHKDIPVTYTQGLSTYQLGYSTLINSLSVSIRENCALSGPAGSPTKAVCTETGYASVSGIQTSSATTSTYSGTYIQQIQVPITAGADKLPSATATCTAAPPRNAAPGSKSISKIAGFGAIAIIVLILL